MNEHSQLSTIAELPVSSLLHEGKFPTFRMLLHDPVLRDCAHFFISHGPVHPGVTYGGVLYLVARHMIARSSATQAREHVISLPAHDCERSPAFASANLYWNNVLEYMSLSSRVETYRCGHPALRAPYAVMRAYDCVLPMSSSQDGVISALFGVDSFSSTDEILVYQYSTPHHTSRAYVSTPVKLVHNVLEDHIFDLKQRFSGVGELPIANNDPVLDFNIIMHALLRNVHCLTIPSFDGLGNGNRPTYFLRDCDDGLVSHLVVHVFAAKFGKNGVIPEDSLSMGSGNAAIYGTAAWYGKRAQILAAHVFERENIRDFVEAEGSKSLPFYSWNIQKYHLDSASVISTRNIFKSYLTASRAGALQQWIDKYLTSYIGIGVCDHLNALFVGCYVPDPKHSRNLALQICQVYARVFTEKYNSHLKVALMPCAWDEGDILVEHPLIVVDTL